MFRFTIRDVLWLIVAGILPVAGMAQESEKPIAVSVSQFGRNNVIGHLGQPLGTIVRITGVSIDGNSTGSRNDTGQTVLEVRTVNGRSISRPVTFTFRKASQGISKPQPGQQFDYFAHEWGSFDGVVLMPGEPAPASDGFYYRREITLHKDNTAATK